MQAAALHNHHHHTQLQRHLVSAAAAARARHRTPTAVVVASAAAGGGSNSASPHEAADLLAHLSRLADKYVLGGSGPGAGKRRSGRRPGSAAAAAGRLPVQAIHVLLGAMAVAGLAAEAGLLPVSAGQHGRAWWAALLPAAAPGGTLLLWRDLFFGYMFGRVVDNTEGGAALWLTAALAAAGGVAAAHALLPPRAPLAGTATTGLLAGLFASALIWNRRKSWHWQRLFELAALTPFVCTSLLAGHDAALGQWSCFKGVAGSLKLQAGWAPIVGGVLGSAVAAGLLALAVGAAEVRQQQQQARRGSSPDGAASSSPLPVTQLIAQALLQVVRRSLSSGGG